MGEGEADSCFRTGPEFKGHENPPLLACILAPLGGVVLGLLITCLGTWLNKVLSRRPPPGVHTQFGGDRAYSFSDERGDQEYVELGTYENLRLGSIRLSTLNPPSDATSTSNIASITESTTSTPINMCGKCKKITLGLCNTILLTLLGCVVLSSLLLLLYYPMIPSYSVCKIDSINWYELFTSFISGGGAQNTVKFNFSVYNPGHLGVTVKDMDGHVFHSGNLIAVGKVHDVRLPGGAITDVSVPVKFEMSVIQATAMLFEHTQGHLYMDFKLHLDGTHILIGGKEFGTFNTGTDYDHVDVELPSDSNLCVC